MAFIILDCLCFIRIWFYHYLSCSWFIVTSDLFTVLLLGVNKITRPCLALTVHFMLPFPHFPRSHHKDLSWMGIGPPLLESWLILLVLAWKLPSTSSPEASYISFRSELKEPFLADAYSESSDQLRDHSACSQGTPHISFAAFVNIVRENHSLYICLHLFILSSTKTRVGLTCSHSFPSTWLCQSCASQKQKSRES